MGIKTQLLLEQLTVGRISDSTNNKAKNNYKESTILRQKEKFATDLHGLTRMIYTYNSRVVHGLRKILFKRFVEYKRQMNPC